MDTFEYLWLRTTPSHRYQDDLLEEYSDDGWEVVNWGTRQGWLFFGLLPPKTWVLLRRRRE